MWYFKGRRKKYKSPYTGKEVDAAVANSQAFPEYAAADSGKFLRVNADGKLDFDEYPIETKVEVIFEGNVTTAESAETVNVVEYDGTADDFSKLTVKVNDETLTYDSTYQSFDDANETVSILLQDSYIKLFAYNANTFAVDIKDVSTAVDEGFSAGVEAVTELPKATSADEGKVIGVDENGKYTLVDGGGGGGDDSILVVNVTYDNDWVIDVPYTDIKSAIAAGKPVILAQYSGSTPLMVFQYSCTLGSGNTEKMKFVSFYIPNNTPSTMQLHIATLNPNYQTQGEWAIFSTTSKNISLS